MAGRARPVGGLLLTHGAGGHRDQPALVAIEDALAPLPVERMNFPYRDSGPKRPPDRAPKLIASIEERAAAFCAAHRIRPPRLALGGRSMGGRMCSMAVAEGLPAAALVLIAYPLHPPGKPDKLRIEHLPALTVPVPVRVGHPGPVRHPGGAARPPPPSSPVRSPTTASRARATTSRAPTPPSPTVIRDWLRSL